MSDLAVRQKGTVQHITDHDVAYISGMDEEMIKDLFGEKEPGTGDRRNS